ncbi:MAG: DUF3035 domain-containing protein [Pelagibacterales bacterium]|nr:DUF3035 domain-containing protein [Pelagibacterales bacterium]
MKKNKFTILIFFGLLFFLSSCESGGLMGGKKDNTDEFLVQKKNPLIQPPDYNDLPLPQDQKIKDDQSTKNIDDEIKKLMESEEKDNVSNNDSAGDSSLEDSIIKILNKN